MPWENNDPSNKTLESLRQEFSLENIQNSNVLTSEPTLEEIGEGQFRMYYDGSQLWQYTRHNGVLYKKQWTQV